MVKHPGGRPVTKGRTRRTYSVDKDVAEYIDTIPDGDRSDFVSAVLSEGVRRRKDREVCYIEIRLRPDQQLDLQEQINERCKGVWFPNPSYADSRDGITTIGVSAQTDTAILDEMGLEYRVVKTKI